MLSKSVERRLKIMGTLVVEGKTKLITKGDKPFTAVSYTHLTLPTICSV